jgi:hypothetical protein
VPEEQRECREAPPGDDAKGGNHWLRTALTEAALSAARTRNSAFGTRYRRIMRHRGHKKAVVAVAHVILVTARHLSQCGTTYRDPDVDYYDRRYPERIRHRVVQALERRGYRVVLESAV